jgi:hypothetical protein
MTRNMRLVQAAASFALTGTGGSCSAVVDLVSVLKGLSIVLRVSVPGLDLIHSSFISFLSYSSSFFAMTLWCLPWPFTLALTR